MSREKQIEEMAEIITTADPFVNCKGQSCLTCEFQDISKNCYSAKALYNAGYRKQSEWISVDERLPLPYESVLVYMPGEVPFPTVREGFITKHGGWYAGGFDRLPDEVVMWQEMPEAPKMKGGAE